MQISDKFQFNEGLNLVIMITVDLVNCEILKEDRRIDAIAVYR